MQKINRQTVTIMRQEITEINETKRPAVGATVIEPPKSVATAERERPKTFHSNVFLSLLELFAYESAAAARAHECKIK